MLVSTYLRHLDAEEAIEATRTGIVVPITVEVGELDRGAGLLVLPPMSVHLESRVFV